MLNFNCYGKQIIEKDISYIADKPRETTWRFIQRSFWRTCIQEVQPYAGRQQEGCVPYEMEQPRARYEGMWIRTGYDKEERRIG